MPTVQRFGSVLIRMFSNDHNPPHFHIVTPDHQAMVRLSDFVVFRGTIDRKSYDIAIQWAREHQEELKDEWNRLNGR